MEENNPHPLDDTVGLPYPLETLECERCGKVMGSYNSGRHDMPSTVCDQCTAEIVANPKLNTFG